MNRITKGNFVSSPKKIIQEINLTFLDDENGASVKNDCLTPDEFYKELSNISPTSNFYLHMNISSLPYHFNDLKYLVENCQNKPKVIRITAYRLKANRTVLSNIDLKDYTFEWTPTAASKGGTLIYIDNKLRYKTRNDLKLYKEREIESTFLEIIEPNNKKSKIIGCIYKHPIVPVTEFTNDYLGPLLEKISCEKKEIILMGYFNINMLNCDSDKGTADFVDIIYASSLHPTINTSTRITAT